MKTCPHASSGCNYPEGECGGACVATKSERLAEKLQKPLTLRRYIDEAAAHILAQEKALESKDKALTAARELLTSDRWGTWQYMESSAVYEDAIKVVNLIKEAQS